MTDIGVFTLLSTIVFAGTTAFIIGFVTEPWRKTSFGRSLMVMACALWLFTLTAVLRHWLGPDYWARTEVRIVAQAMIAYAIWNRFIVLMVLKRERREREARR